MMLQKLAKRSTWMLPVLFFVLSVALLYGAPQTGSDKMSPNQTVTGCLQKGGEPVGFFIISKEVRTVPIGSFIPARKSLLPIMSVTLLP